MSKVSIIGKGLGWENAPVTECDWGITQLNLRRPVTRVIDMNDYSLWGEREAADAKLSRLLAEKGNIPYVDLGSYPLKEIMDEFDTDYFSSTVDYVLALAIYEGFKEIHLYGCSMILGSEYSYQKPGMDFWCGMAKGRGVKVVVHGKEATAMRTQDQLMYGYGFPQVERS
jgi:hypothetical protein